MQTAFVSKTKNCKNILDGSRKVER